MDQKSVRALRYSESPIDEERKFIEKIEEQEGRQGQLTELLHLHRCIFTSYPLSVGNRLSWKSRLLPNERIDSALTYGEVSFSALIYSLIEIKNIRASQKLDGFSKDSGGLFVDIGSGIGKGVIAASLYHNFTASIGIEILEALYDASLSIRSSWERNFNAKANRTTSIDFRLGDATDPSVFNWYNADIVFMNSTCFDHALMSKLSKCCDNLPSGSFVITLTKELPSKNFEVMHHSVHLMSWGGATVYIQQRINMSNSKTI